jgi:hypothetical protein
MSASSAQPRPRSRRRVDGAGAGAGAAAGASADETTKPAATGSPELPRKPTTNRSRVKGAFAGNTENRDQGAQTPVEVLRAIHEMFDDPDAVRDVCPIDHPETGWDGLKEPWGERNYCNPPYHDMLPWLLRAAEQRDLGRSSVVLCPYRTHTQWWREGGMRADHVCMIEAGIRFTDSRTGEPYGHKSPFSLALVVYDAGHMVRDAVTQGGPVVPSSVWRPPPHATPTQFRARRDAAE